MTMRRLSSLCRPRNPTCKYVLPIFSIAALIYSINECWRCNNQVLETSVRHVGNSDRKLLPEDLVLSSVSGRITNSLQTKSTDVLESQNKNAAVKENAYKVIKCHINAEYDIPCRREKEEVFVPFSFIQNYFDITGKLEKEEEGGRLQWLHSYSKISKPRENYTTGGVYMHFDHYFVENRDTVKCISGIEHVPVCNQWNVSGYYYPLQIAQYGLSHYSKLLVEQVEPRKTVLLSLGVIKKKRWAVNRGDTLTRVLDPLHGGYVIEFSAEESFAKPGIVFSVNEKENFILSFDLRFKQSGSLTVVVETNQKRVKRKLFVTYVCSDVMISVSGEQVYYGIGSDKCRTWRTITRDIFIDIEKGLGKKKVNKRVSKIVGIHLRGHGWINNITTSSSAHLTQFYHAADWLLRAQDQNGGWPNMVTHWVAKEAQALSPGWYSAMAQGHAMSVLTRAYLHSKEKKYLEAAVRGLKPFDVKSANNGVLALFMDKYAWYEEYPTTPSLFVLNGFIFSLMGLYDLRTVLSDNKDVQRLYSQGLTSLKALLPLFDTGSGTTYDLRHVTMKLPPNRARWDYHTTHIVQLLVLSSVESDPIFATTAQRWSDYTRGVLSPHN
ncbi:D-glucuronyl C5-epimerase B-like [Lingula anatina]|uniref:heparosan-N-sulfate-glucuronate 5-epimerase n=1 Tax=Lingula anatina TaxID=7574 RepID=A0A1S3I8R7_LINAN|nr:D-glucuronyl C5-epimerase B-like [Lingula anatina]|eukprot:XP_013394261.1 D-glucuronyl C5-epimerase B-like [Lingula anatina]